MISDNSQNPKKFQIPVLKAPNSKLQKSVNCNCQNPSNRWSRRETPMNHKFRTQLEAVAVTKLWLIFLNLALKMEYYGLSQVCGTFCRAQTSILGGVYTEIILTRKVELWIFSLFSLMKKYRKTTCIITISV